jgi:hypothetical protein
MMLQRSEIGRCKVSEMGSERTAFDTESAAEMQFTL